MFAFTVEPFQPHPLFRHPHAQTVLTALTMRSAKEMQYQRIRIETPDDDFLDLDFPQAPGITLADDAPILLLMHGMEGRARSGYGEVMYELALRQGIRPIGMNYRACSGEMNRTAISYSLGYTKDVHFVHQWIHEQYPSSPLMFIGVSLGANLLLKYLGEHSDQMDHVVAAAAISPFFKTEKPHRISHEGGASRFYRERILRQMKAKVRRKAALIHAAGGNVYDALKARTLLEFDAAVTAPLFGFTNTDDYYLSSASIGYLEKVNVPTLIMRSQDDPFFDLDIPWDIFKANPCLVPAITDHGGHVGFMEGVPGWGATFWAQRQAARFFAAALAARRASDDGAQGWEASA